MIVSLTPLGVSSTLVVPISTFVADLALDIAALKASHLPQTLIAPPTAPLVAPGLYLIARPNLVIPLGVPAQWRCGLVQIKDYTFLPDPNISITGPIDGQSDALLTAAGEALSFHWHPDDQTWVSA
jgi:hypothetical protein